MLGAGDDPGIWGEEKKKKKPWAAYDQDKSVTGVLSGELRQEEFVSSFKDDSYAHKYLPKLYLATLFSNDFFS